MPASRSRVGLSVLLPVVLPALALCGPAEGAAQERTTGELRREIQDSRQRLEEVREERAALQREMDGLRSRVRDVSGELLNIERQLSASRTALQEIDFQVEATNRRIEAATRELLDTREELAERRAVLDRRLRSIYMRGPLHTAEVLLGAESFADLLNRYRYLRMIAHYDRALFDAIRSLEGELQGQTREMRASLAELDRLRDFQLGEVQELREVEEERARTLQRFRTEEEEAASRLEELARDEERMGELVAGLEERRVQGEADADGDPDPAGADDPETGGPGADSPVPPAAGLGPDERGGLPWPVQGELAYRFGPERRPGGAVLRWNGIGIEAPLGTPVRAVRSGTVELAGAFEGYGPSVIVGHGDGFYTLYLHLGEVGVVEGRAVEEGQVVGTVGDGGPLGRPLVEFQIRGPVDGGPLRAVDPLPWLSPPDGAGGGE